MSRAVLHHRLSAGVAQLIVSAALKVTMQVIERIVSGLMRFVPGESTRLAVFAAVAKPTMARAQSRRYFPKRKRVLAMFSSDYHGLRRFANKSLERMPAEHSCFAVLVVSGHRSAHRWTAS